MKIRNKEKIKMRWIPIDQSRVKFLGTECAAEVYEWKDGKKADHQSIDVGEGTGNTGMPLWVVDVMVIGGGDRAEIAGIQVPSREKPIVPINQIVEFERPEVNAYPQLKGRGDRVKANVMFSYRAAGIAGGVPQQRPEKAA